jgi:hypothetical protein
VLATVRAGAPFQPSQREMNIASVVDYGKRIGLVNIALHKQMEHELVQPD